MPATKATPRKRAKKKATSKKVATKPRKSKYNVSAKEARTYKGIVFDSKWEMRCYILFEQHGIPKEHIQLQPKFTLLDRCHRPDGSVQRAIHYIGDFVLGPHVDNFDTGLTNDHILIDCKGMETDVFKIKNKLFISKFGRVIHKPKTNQEKVVAELVDMYKERWAT